jgi:hypothetical protein
MTASASSAAASPAVVTDPLPTLDQPARARLAAIAHLLIPAAHGMPSAADILTDDRLRFVLAARPDLAAPLAASLRPELGEDPTARLERLGREEPAALGALQLVIVAAYYTDKGVRELIGYPGQLAIEVKSWLYPPYLEEGLIDAVLARGPVWRDPATGRRAVTAGAPRTYEERAWAAAARSAESAASGPAEGGHDGDDHS